MLLACVSHNLGAVALGDHDHAAAVILEEIHIRIHTVGGCRAHRATGHSFRSLGRAGVEHRMILEVLWKILTPVKSFLKAGVCDVTGHDDGAVKAQTG